MRVCACVRACACVCDSQCAFSVQGIVQFNNISLTLNHVCVSVVNRFENYILS